MEQSYTSFNKIEQDYASFNKKVVALSAPSDSFPDRLNTVSQTLAGKLSRTILLLLFLGTASGTTWARHEMETLRVIEKPFHGMEAERAEIEMTPGGVTLIDGEELHERNISSLADMLRFVPGIWSVSDSGTDNMFFSSRGTNLDSVDWDMNGIKLFQDGLPVTTADGNNHNRIIDPLSSQYATVARGANAMKYGASTLGGAINFVTPTARDTSPLQLFVHGGSHGQANGRATFSKVFSDNLDGMITIAGKQWDGYREHNEQDRFGIYSNAGWRISDSVTSRFYATYLKNDQELAGTLSRGEIDADPDQASDDAIGGNFQRDVRTWRIANKTTWVIDDNKQLDVGVSFERQELFHPIVDRILADFDGPGPAPPVEVFSLLVDTDQENIGTMLRYNQRMGYHGLLFGINYTVGDEEGGNFRNLGGSRNGLRESVDNNAWSLETYAMDRWRLNDSWMLVYGAQFTAASRSVKNITVADGSVRNPADDYFSINPRAGLIYHVNDNSTVFANVSRLFEPPTHFQLEDNVAGGNATLDAMKGAVIEIGSRGNRKLGEASSFNWDISLYYSWIRDEILSVEDPLAPGESLVTNIDDTIHAGVEAVFGHNLALDDSGQHSIQSKVSLTINEFSFDNDPTWGNNDLPAAPGYVVKGEFLYRNHNGFYFGPAVDLVDDRFADFANSFKVDSYFLLGLRAGWSGDRWKLFAEVRNLLDEEYIATHSVRNVAPSDAAILRPGEPLSVYFGVRFQY